MGATRIGVKNINVELSGEVTIKFPVDPVGELSSTGKSMVVATTGGFIDVGGYRINLTVIKSKR